MDKIELISKFLEEAKGSKVRIVMHASPDPDAVGSAMGFQSILKQNNIESSMAYSGEISHPQNKTIVNILSVPITKNSAKNGNIDVCVDCTERNSIAEDPLLVIDHHRIESEAKYKIIDSNYGANSTIIWEIMREMDLINKDEVDTHTALLLGVRTDTNDLISETMSKNDFVAYQELLELADKDKLQKVMNYPLPRYLYNKRMALHEEGNSQEANGVFVGGIGFVPEEQRDVIAILAEEYTRMESVQTAVIFAITGKRQLEVSVRTHLVSLDVNQMMQDLFGGFGGGKSNAGGAKIPLNFYIDLDDKSADQFWKVTRKHMFRNVLKENWNNSEIESEE